MEASSGKVMAMGPFLFTSVSALIAWCKVMGVNDWSWWRVCLPLGAYLGFNLTHIATGLIYLRWIDVANGPGWTEQARVAKDEKREYLRLGLVHFAFFALGVSEWASPSEGWNGFWNAFGNAGVMIAFGSLAIVNLILYWWDNIRLPSESQSAGGADEIR